MEYLLTYFIVFLFVVYVLLSFIVFLRAKAATAFSAS